MANNRYFMTGTYEEDGETRACVGIMNLNPSDWTFEGFFLAPESPYRTDKIKGRVFTTRNERKLVFTRQHEREKIDYVLEKPTRRGMRNENAGKYEGLWSCTRDGVFCGEDEIEITLRKVCPNNNNS